MGCCDDLKALLAPLGLYDLSAGARNEAELFALGAALDGVDAPVRPDVELTAEQAANFTYGEDMIANLKLPDWNVIAANQANWIASWNAIFSVK